MAQTLLGPAHKAWITWLDEQGFPCGGVRRNVLARVLVMNKFKSLRHMKVSGSLDLWLGYDRLELPEVVFLTEQMRKEPQVCDGSERPPP